MPSLVALDLPGGPQFVQHLQQVWARGDTVLVLDQRFSLPAKHALVSAMRASAVIDTSGEASIDGGEPTATGDALVMCTSGSTGQPKGVVLTHHAVQASAAASSARLGITAQHHWLACLPLAHVGGMAVVTRALFAGTGLTVLPGFDLAEVQQAAAEGATHTSLVATALHRIDPAMFSRIVLGGSQPPTNLPPNVVTTYGLTETGSGVVYDGVPLDGVEVRLDTDGEIMLRGPMLFRGYRDGTGGADPDGWFHTNDLGQWNEDRLVVQGRRGDLIITGGENVWPDVVERILIQHPQVADVGVAAMPDSEWGHVVCAWVVPTNPDLPPELAKLREFTKSHLPAYMAPRRVVMVESLPRTALGKLVRAHLVRHSTKADV